MRFVAETAGFPVICHVSDAKDITRNRRETSLRYKQFGKGIVKYNALKQNFTLFCSTSEPKGVSFTLWIFRWRIFDRRDVLYALGNDKVENDQPHEAANVLYWFEKVPYLLCWKLGRTLPFSLQSEEWSPRVHTNRAKNSFMIFQWSVKQLILNVFQKNVECVFNNFLSWIWCKNRLWK